MSVIFRAVMVLAGVITGWFFAQDAANFTVIQTIISLLLIVIFFAIAAFWPALVERYRKHKERTGP